jgi:dihydroorotase
MKLLIRGGHVISPLTELSDKNDVLIEDGRVQCIAGKIPVTADMRVLDAFGKIVSPGFIDAHSHLRDPGFTHRETLATGARAAALGGYTSIIAMANTSPAIDTPEIVEDVLTRAHREAVANIFVMGAISKDRKGEEIADLPALKQAGVIAFGDDAPFLNSSVMWRAFNKGRELGLPFCLHCEDPRLANKGRMNEGRVSQELGLKGRPNVSEAAALARDLTIGTMAGVTFHVLHLSTKEGVKILRWAKSHGIKVTAEVTPHHFTLTDEAVIDYGPNAMISPPLRSREDVEEIKTGLKDGTIDLIATDHAPHASYEKQDIETANFGLIGLETAFSQILQELVRPGVLSLAQALFKLTSTPASLYGLKNKGTLKPKSDADICIIDLEYKWEVTHETLQSKSKNSPYLGWIFKGAPVTTIVGGHIIMQDRRFLERI